MTSQLDAVARQALAAYGLDGAPLVFIRHSDSVAFRVEAPGSDGYLLRLHIPITPAMGSHGADGVMVRSELQWLEALNDDTDLVLQRPIRNRDDELVTTVPVGAGALHCSLLRWLPGEAYDSERQTEDTARQIGRILATLHRHASEWRPPPDWRRPARDAAYFEAVLWALRPAVEDGRIARDDYVELAKAVAQLVERIRELPRHPDVYGVMHADAHKGNMLLDGGEVRLIDFSFCATGNYMFDLGVCLSDMSPALHGTFVEGYRGVRPLPEGWAELAEGFFLGAMVGTFSFWVPRPEAHEHLAAMVPRIVQEYVLKHNRGEPFWPYA